MSSLKNPKSGSINSATGPATEGEPGHDWGKVGTFISPQDRRATEGERDAKKLAKELVYSVRGWGQRSPAFMTAMVEKWATKIEAWSWQPTAGVGAESPEKVFDDVPSNPHGWRLVCRCCGCQPNFKECSFNCVCHDAARAESPSTAAPPERCMRTPDGNYPHCSLEIRHEGNHKAFESHNQTEPLLEEWAAQPEER